MPPQHQEKPGIEAKVTLRPAYRAPLYRGSGKLEDRVALITGCGESSPPVQFRWQALDQSVVCRCE